MLQLAGTGALRLDARTVSGRTLGDNLSWWETSERRRRVRQRLAEVDSIDPDDVIRPLDRRLPSTVTFLTGSIAPGGAIVKSTAIAPHLLDEHGVYHHRGNARVFTSEDAAIDAIKRDAIHPGQVLVLIGLGPGIGMPETYQITAALKAVDPAGRIPLVTDGRFSGVSTGPCVGHISPEAWAGGPIGRLRDGDLIEIHIDTARNTGRVDILEPDSIDARPLNDGLRPDPRVPDDTRLWAALQAVGGGSWGGCVYDVDRIIELLSRSGAPLDPSDITRTT
jgi:dihydroxyacid dehydratase/phosphogluconate dehydratase